MAIFRNNTDKRYYFHFIFSKKFTDRTKERYYSIPKRNILDDIRRKIDRIKERFRTKQKRK
jgi:hypothetical protein